MKVEPGRTRLVAIYQGHSYWFCAEGCRNAFETNPKKYLEGTDKPKGWWGRYLERMAKDDLKWLDLPVSGMSCASCVAKVEKGLSRLNGS
jgi:YHS domain-containing protein